MSPFAGYKNFDACVTDQIKKGKKKESALKICGFLKHKYEQASKKEKQATSMRTTDIYYRFRPEGRDPSKYVRFRTKVLDAKKGIKAVIGFKKSGGSEIQSYLFLKNKWTPGEAKKWLKQYKLGNQQLSYKENIHLSSEVSKMDENQEKLEEIKEDDIQEEEKPEEVEKDEEIMDEVEEDKEPVEEPVIEEPKVEEVEESKEDFEKKVEELSKKLEVIDELSEELTKANITIQEKTEQLSQITKERDELKKRYEELSVENSQYKEQLSSLTKVEEERLSKQREERLNQLVKRQIEIGSVKENLREERLSALSRMSEEALKVIEESVNSLYDAKQKEPELLSIKKPIEIERTPDFKNMNRKDFFLGVAKYLESKR